MLSFRPLTRDDLPLMLEWLQKPHVREWWDDGEDTLEKVALHYGEEDEEVRRFILSQEERPIGYFQYYFAGDGTIGIDQFIGEEDCLGRGIGTEAIGSFVEMIRREHRPGGIVLDPAPENKRAVRCYEKVGFRHYETVTDEKGVRAYMMRLETGD